MSTELKVGALVLVALAVLGYFIVQIEGWGRLDADSTYAVRVLFDNVAGLTSDAPVLLAGVRVGEVESVSITDDGRAEVVVRLRRDVVLRQDAVASVGSLGVMGDKYLEVRPGTPGEATVGDGGEIRGGRPTSMDQMVAVVSDIAEDLQETTASLRSVLGTEEGETTLRDILANVEGFTSELDQLVRENRASLSGGVGEFESTVASINRLSTELEGSLPDMVQEMRDVAGKLAELIEANEGDLGAASGNLVEITERLDRSATELEEVISKVNRGEGSVSRMINEPETIEKLHDALESVDDTLAAADTFFRRVGQAQFSFNLRSEFYEKLDTTKNYFGMRLELGEETTDRALIVSLIDDNIGGISETNITREFFDANGNLIDRTIQREIIRQEGFTFSAQLAQRVGPWQLRGGLFESEAGFGVDYVPGERWQFAVEAWDLGRDPDPHLKLRAQYQLFGRFFLTAGWDDLLRDDLRQVFFGGGYSFRSGPR